jgi:hypothetical protein
LETAIAYCVLDVGTGTSEAGTVAVQLVDDPQVQGIPVLLNVQVVPDVKPVPASVRISEAFHVFPSCEKPLVVT